MVWEQYQWWLVVPLRLLHVNLHRLNPQNIVPGHHIRIILCWDFDLKAWLGFQFLPPPPLLPIRVYISPPPLVFNKSSAGLECLSRRMGMRSQAKYLNKDFILHILHRKSV